MKTLTVRILNDLLGALVCCSSAVQKQTHNKYKQQCDTSNGTSNSGIQATVYIVINGHRHSSIERAAQLQAVGGYIANA